MSGMSKFAERRRRPLAEALASLLAAAVWSSGAAAQGAALEEVVVTATKRAESLQDVPAAITAFSASDIERSRITRPADFIEMTPGVVLSDSNHPGEALITIRGTAQTRNTETPVAVVVDGVLMTGRTQFNGELFDIEQIEILKGPQGYLYGRNAIGGAIVIQTRRPENEWRRSVTLGYGNYNHARARLSAGGALIDDELWVQFSGSFRDRDGFYKNITRGDTMDPMNELVGRARVIWEPKNTNFTVDFRATATDLEAGATAFSPQSAFPAFQTSPQGAVTDINKVEDIPFVRNVASEARQEKASYALKLDYEAPFGTFTSVTTYDDTLDVFTTDDFPYYPTQDTTQFNAVSHEAWSQEIRFTSPEDKRLRYMLGAYYVDIENAPNLHAAIGIDPGGFVLPAFRPRPPGDANATTSMQSDNVFTEAWAIFFSLNYDITDSLELTLAGRYDHEDKETIDNSPLSPFFLQERQDSFDEFQPAVKLAWKPTDDLTVFGGYSRGFQAGGFNGAQTELISAGVAPNEFGAAVDDNFELGFKGRFLDRRLNVNAAVFYTDKENAQQFNFVPAGTLNAVLVIDEVEVLGFEMDAEAQITDNFQIGGGFAYIDAEVKKFADQPETVGNRAPFVPEFTAVINATHFWALPEIFGQTGMTLVSNLQYEHRGTQFFEARNVPDWKREALNLLDARIALESDNGWTLSVWGKNLTNKIFAEDVVPIFAPGNVLGLPITAATFRSMPRTWGMELSYDF